MKKISLRTLTVIAFVLIPVVAIIRLMYPAPTLPYGHYEVTVNSVFLLLFALYAFSVVTATFTWCHHLWAVGDSRWKGQVGWAYAYVFIFAAAILCLLMFQAHTYKDPYVRSTAVYPAIWGVAAFCPGVIAELGFYVGPVFFFPVGVVLLGLGIRGLWQANGRPWSYLVTLFGTGVLFGLAAPWALIMFEWWMGGGIAPF